MQYFTMASESRKRWEAFWECESCGRPLLLTCASAQIPDPVRPLLKGSAPAAPLPPPENDENKLKIYKKWFDIDTMIDMNLRHAANIIPGYEYTMQFDTKWSVAYCMPFGVKCEYNEYAAWCEPLDGMTCSSDFAFDFYGEWFKWLYEGTRRIIEAGKNLYYSTPVMWGNHSGDTLSNLVGLDQLMYDCIDDPESVRRALDIITDAQIKAFSMLRALEKDSGLPGTRNYTCAWSPKTSLSMDCDISAMVSPEMYKDIFLPPIERMMETVEHRIYHLDGPVCLQHLPVLLELPQLQAIQWVAGAGRDNPMDWIELYKKIQKAGKAIIVYAGYDQVVEICKQLSPEGLAIHFWSPSEDAMHDMAKKVAALY